MVFTIILRLNNADSYTVVLSPVSGVQSHLMTSPLMYGGRSGLSMLGGLQAAQQSMMVGSLSSQVFYFFF